MTQYKTVAVQGLDIFYREAGSRQNPTILLLHGFPTSSFMFRNLIRELSQDYHLIAPDYPGYGHSSAPAPAAFDYSFDNVAALVDEFVEAVGLTAYSLYVMDYGAPVGFRLAAKHPERVQALMVQNGNAYDEGLREFWDPIRVFWKDPSDPEAVAPILNLLTLESTRWQYTNGARNPEAISPDTWQVDQSLLDRPGNAEIQGAMLYSYSTNPPLYPAWQAYFRQHQPPTLIVWGKNDYIFPAEGAHPYLRDLPDAELHLLDTGHFALEEDGDTIANLIQNFLNRKVKKSTADTLVSA